MRHVLILTALVAGLPAFGAPKQPDYAIAAPVVKVFEPGVTRTDQLPTWELRRLRKQMLAGERLSFQEMRRLADAGDGLAAFRYGRRLVAQGDPELLPAAALYFASAAYSGRDYAVRPLVRLLEGHDLTLSERRKDHLENALRAFAVRGNAIAAEALARFYASGEPFGRHPDRARSLLLEMAEAGDQEAAERLLTRTLSGAADLSTEDMQRLVRVLNENAETLGEKALAQNLERRLESRGETE